MGYEYRVKFTYQSVAEVDEFLRALSCFERFDAARDVYIYRETADKNDMPSAEISIEKGGLYLCDYGMTAELFSLLVKRLISYFQSVQIEDWE